MNKQQLADSLPLELQTIWQKTEKPFVRIITERARAPLPPTASKFGGVPYMPYGSAYPECRGEPLYLLAQINFAEVRRATGSLVSVGNAVLPEQGVLQIFIAGNDLYGLDFDRPYPQKGSTYQVCFYEHDGLPEDASAAARARNIFESLFRRNRQAETGFPNNRTEGGLFSFVKSLFQQPGRPEVAASGLQTAGEAVLPLYGEYALYFERDSAGLSSSDEVEGRRWFGEEGFWAYCERLAADDEEAERIFNGFGEIAPMFGHQLFGYPSFTQFDVRDADSKEVLLLQIGSEYDDGGLSGIMWGDAGIGNFFIAPEDLAAKRFDRLRYHWDCG
ncbi:MAG: YwqG family protein [Neisseria sp.]|nr:YwqG family protein [Neisseria sp.]